MSDVTIGKIIDENARRDAIHFAIAPVVSLERLYPGQHVGLSHVRSDGVAQVSALNTPIGIVDPFLAGPVYPDQRFYLLLYPGTVTGMRHEWTHPAFGGVPADPAPDKAASEKWLRSFATRFSPYYKTEQEAYDELCKGLRSESLFRYGHDLSGLYDFDESDELREHAEIVLGIRINWGNFTFSCSC